MSNLKFWLQPYYGAGGVYMPLEGKFFYSPVGMCLTHRNLALLEGAVKFQSKRGWEPDGNMTKHGSGMYMQLLAKTGNAH